MMDYMSRGNNSCSCALKYIVQISGEINSSDKEPLPVSDLVTQNPISMIIQTSRHILPNERCSC